MNNTVNENTKTYRILKTLIAVCFSFIILFVIIGIIVSPDMGLFHESAKEYDEDWTKEDAYGNKETLTMPTSLKLKDGDVVSLTTILPTDIEDGMYLSIYTGKSFTAYVGDNEIYRFDNSISKLPGRITKAIIVPIPLEESYAGRPLKLVITNGKYERNSINTAYIGSLMGILLLLIKNYALQFVMALLLVIASLITITIFIYVEKRANKKAPLIYLAGGILAISSWIICDSPVFQLAFQKYFFDGVTGFMLVITMGLPFLLYFDEITERRHHRLFAVCETVSVLNFIVLTIFHMTGLFSYDRFLIYVDLMLLVYIGVMITCTIADYLKSEDKSHKNVIIGLVGLSIFSFFEIVVTILSSIMPFKIDIGGLFVIIGMIILLVFAILDQVKVFEEFKEETQNALAATKAKSNFLANMSHEIRTPINAIMGMNEIVLRESNQENVKEYAKDIRRASDNLLHIVNDILDLSKIESGKLEIIKDNYDLGELIYDATSLVNMKAEDKGLKLNISVDENLPCKLYGDDKRVREIIINILNNAVKYTEKGFVNLKVDGVTNENIVSLKIVVEDSGQGIRREDLVKIFSGFSQVNVKKNKNIEGTGLGLSITKSLIELMEGSITVDSEYGKGSTFTVILPQQIVSDEKMGNFIKHRHASSKSNSAAQQEIQIPDVKILAVDDTELNLKVISRFLARTKANVTCATSGEEMLSLIKENVYDIILLDHMMPNMDGIETLKMAKGLEDNKCVNVPVIALTANAILGAKEMYLEAGFDDYLSKPVKMDELCEMLIKYLPEDKIES